MVFDYTPHCGVGIDLFLWCSQALPIPLCLSASLSRTFNSASVPIAWVPAVSCNPAADGLKLIFKEDIVPESAYKAVYYIAPVLKTVPILIIFAVLPGVRVWIFLGSTASGIAFRLASQT